MLPVGQTAPHFRLLDNQGRSLGLDDLVEARGVVLLFFSSDWLKGDLALLRLFAESYPRFQEQGIEVLGLSAINWETLHHLAKRLEIPFPLLFDPCCRYSRIYKTMLIPKFITGRAVYALDANRVIRLAKPNSSPDSVLKVLINN